MWILSSGSTVTSDAIKEFNTQSARTTAIVGAAIVEDCLKRLIELRFPVEGEVKKQLFKANGPLGNLDAKIKVAYSMGIVSKQALQDLEKIAQIRNKFAHRLDISDFEHPEIAPICNALVLIEKHLFERGTPEASIPEEVSSRTWIENLDEELASPRRRYFLSIIVLHGINMHVPHPENGKPPLPRPLI